MISQLTLEPQTIAHDGFEMRHWRADADYEWMSRVLIASRNADGLEEARTGEDLARMYARMKNFEPMRDLFLVERDGELVGYAGCRWWEETRGDFIHGHWFFVLPEYRGRGIEKELLRVSQARLRTVLAERANETANWFQMFAYGSETWASAVLLADGYEPVRYFHDMVCRDLENVPDAAFPPGIETRPATPDQSYQIWKAGGEAFSEHWGEAVEEESDFERWLKNPKWNQSLWQVAWDGDQVVGMVLNYVDAHENQEYGFRRGYTEEICVRKPWRGRGIAKALLVKSMKMFRDMGFDHTALGVDTANQTGALQLYESVGYKTVRTETFYRKGV